MYIYIYTHIIEDQNFLPAPLSPICHSFLFQSQFDAPRSHISPFSLLRTINVDPRYGSLDMQNLRWCHTFMFVAWAPKPVRVTGDLLKKSNARLIFYCTRIWYDSGNLLDVMFRPNPIKSTKVQNT